MIFEELTIQNEADLARAVQELGIVPFFANAIEGFSIEEHVEPGLWFTDEPGPWEWKGPVIRETGCAYGKLFQKKAAYVSREWYPDLANWRRDGYDFDARWEDELVPYKDKVLYDLLDEKAPILSGRLKEAGHYRKGGNTGFDTIITRLQHQCYVVVSDFAYQKDRYGQTYGWGVAEYSTPEKMFGEYFCERVYSRTPEESLERVVSHLKTILPETGESQIRRFLGTGSPVRREAGRRFWLVPSNPKYFDVVSAFRESEEIFWKQGNDNIRPGDTVFLYVGVPYSAILYRCTVTETEIPFHGHDEHVNIKQMMRIRRDKIYAPDMLNRDVLKKYGVVSVRCTRSAPPALVADWSA